MQVLLKLVFFLLVETMGHSFQPQNPCSSGLEILCLSISSCFQA